MHERSEQGFGTSAAFAPRCGSRRGSCASSPVNKEAQRDADHRHHELRHRRGERHRLCLRTLHGRVPGRARGSVRHAIRGDGVALRGNQDRHWLLSHQLRRGRRLHREQERQFISHAPQRQPQDCAGRPERFIRTRREQKLCGFAHRFNNYWIIGWIDYRTPAARQFILLGETS
jgi:hypothetical protein